MILIFLGGMFGASLRFFISERFTSNLFSTWLVNITGAFLLVLLYVLYHDAIISHSTFIFWGTGFSGAYTTFSTINNQLFDNLLKKNYKRALLISLTNYLIILLFILIFYFLLNSF